MSLSTFYTVIMALTSRTLWWNWNSTLYHIKIISIKEPWASQTLGVFMIIIILQTFIRLSGTFASISFIGIGQLERTLTKLFAGALFGLLPGCCVRVPHLGICAALLVLKLVFFKAIWRQRINICFVLNHYIIVIFIKWVILLSPLF